MKRVVVVLVALTVQGCDRAGDTRSDAMTTAPSVPVDARGAETPSATASASSPPMDRDRACDFARTALAELASTFPTKCVRDADCEGYHIGASSCDPAIVLAKPGVPPSSEGRLLDLQRSARESCLPTAPCSPSPFRAQCRVGRCVDAMRAR